MASLLTFRDGIKNFCSKYDRIVAPAARFILALLMFWSIVHITGGHNETISSGLVVFLLAVVCAFIPESLTYAIGGIVAFMNYFSGNKETGISFIIIFVIMYCLYIRFFPKATWVIMYAPLFFIIKMQYVLPILAGMLVGPIAIVPLAFGAIFYYFSLDASNYLLELSKTTDAENMLESYKYIFQHLIDNKNMLLTIIVFAVVLIITHVIYRLSVEYSWYAAIIVGGLFEIILFLVGNVVLNASISIGEILLGSICAVIIATVAQFFKTVVDYSRVENTQFEDEEYYYYVKAVPKIVMTKQQKNVKKINTVTQNNAEEDSVSGVTR